MATTTEDVKAIEAFLRRASQINNEGDVEVWADLFDEEGIFMLPDGPEISTREGLIRQTKSFYNEFKSDITITPVEIQVFGDWAFDRTRVTGTLINKLTGEIINVDAKEIAIMKRQATGEWKVWRLIGNNNQPKEVIP